MAKGQLLLLFDEDCKLMIHFLEKRKVYQWDILWGIKTDTEDALGLITNEKKIDFNESDYNRNYKKLYRNISTRFSSLFSNKCI